MVVFGQIIGLHVLIETGRSPYFIPVTVGKILRIESGDIVVFQRESGISMVHNVYYKRSELFFAVTAVTLFPVNEPFFRQHDPLIPLYFVIKSGTFSVQNKEHFIP